ncbi:MAG: HD domain-containing protein [Deltaproteobacteria bacterium]|nr:HD domain-containing protein [Deltaproteobacteria bacterium]
MPVLGLTATRSPSGSRIVLGADDPLRVTFRDVVRTISLALEMDERGKLHHGVRVALLAHRIGEAIGVPDVGHLYYAGLLHDLGAMGIADQIVHDAMHERHGPELRAHPERGAQIVRPLSVLRPFEAVIRDHHERVDGRGFPHGKCGEEIPLGASIIRVADQIELAMRAGPPEGRLAAVRKAITREAAGGVPLAVAGAALVTADARLLDQLCDERILDDTLSAFCPPQPGVLGLTRHALLSQLLWVLARVIDAKHAHTMGHSVRVAYWAHEIAQAFASDVNPWDVAWAGFLHDVGIVGVPARLLAKPGALEDEDVPIVQRHAADSQRIIATIRDLSHLASAAAAHHERYDGGGYPRGLAGEAIPFIGRILAYADVYDALTSARAHRDAMTHAEALTAMRSMVGSTLDPHLARVALDALQRAGHDAAENQRGVGFTRFFDSDEADLDGAFGRDSGVGTALRVPNAGAAPLLALDPWITFEITEDRRIVGPAAALRELTGATSDRLLEAFGTESARMLLGAIAQLGESETHTQYVFTRAARPLEVIVMRRGGKITLLCQSAARRLQTMERLALFYRNFLSSTEAIVFVDPRGFVVDVNQSFVDVFGYDREAIVGKHTRLLRSGRQDEPFYRAMWEAITDPARASWSGELVDRRRDGKEVDVRLSTEAVRDAMGNCIGYIGHFSDVTARNRAEEELRLRKTELQMANDDLLRVSRFKDELIAMTSHDLRGPLGAIASLAALVRQNLERLPQEKVAGHLERIRETATRLTEFVTDLLDLDKSESGQLVLRPCRVRLDELLEQCVERARATTTRPVAIELTLAERPLELVADPVRAEQVFANLIGNAVKFSPDGQVVSVSAAIAGDGSRYVVRVEDRGPGIPEHALEAVFDRYYQVQATSGAGARSAGSGLGLTIVKNLVSLHGGSVRAENRGDGGSRFVVELPVDRAAPELNTPVVVLLARASAQTEAVARTLGGIGAYVLRADVSERAGAVCALTGADVLLFEDAAAGAATSAFVSERSADGAALPVVARLCDDSVLAGGVDAAAEISDVSFAGSVRSLVAPVLDSELRELLREAALRRNALGRTP